MPKVSIYTTTTTIIATKEFQETNKNIKYIMQSGSTYQVEPESRHHHESRGSHPRLPKSRLAQWSSNKQPNPTHESSAIIQTTTIKVSINQQSSKPQNNNPNNLKSEPMTKNHQESK